MRRSAGLYLEDLLRAANYILNTTRDMSREEYFAHPDIPFAVERNFMIIGEALAQMKQHHPSVFAQIPDAQVIIRFRNVLVHVYASVDSRAVWSIIQSDLVAFRDGLDELLRLTSGSEA